MNQYLITFRSVTYAQRGERLLNRGGFSCSLRRTPRWMEEQGCGYSLRVSEGRLHETKQALGEAGGRYQKIYRKEADGQWQEVSP